MLKMKIINNIEVHIKKTKKSTATIERFHSLLF